MTWAMLVDSSPMMVTIRVTPPAHLRRAVSRSVGMYCAAACYRPQVQKGITRDKLQLIFAIRSAASRGRERTSGSSTRAPAAVVADHLEVLRSLPPRVGAGIVPRASGDLRSAMLFWTHGASRMTERRDARAKAGAGRRRAEHV